MDRSGVARWVEGYERAWRTPGTAALAELFTSDVVYSPSPWSPPLHGLEAVARFWEAERDGPDEGFSLTSEVVAVEHDTAVVRLAVDYQGADTSHWRDLWVLRFEPDGRCASFEEWPFAPRQHDGHG